MIVLDHPDRSQDFSRSEWDQISQALSKDQVIVYPTDTLYGLGVDATSNVAVAKLYKLKARENSPISVLLGSVDELLMRALDLSESAKHLIRQFLPGALTVICKSEYPFARRLYSQNGSIGFRVSGDSLAGQIPELYGQALTTTSVNPAGLSPASSQAEVQNYFKEQVALMIDVGQMKSSRGSTIIDLCQKPFKILREGEISRHVLQEFLN